MFLDYIMIRIRVLIAIGLLSFSLDSFSQTGEVPIDPEILPGIVRITSPSLLFPGKLTQGSGFIVWKRVTDGRDTTGVVFLVTNKHMISDWTYVDSIASRHTLYIEVSFYSKLSGVAVMPQTRRIAVLDSNGQVNDNVLEHNEPSVDVCVILLGTEIVNNPLLKLTSFHVNFLLPFEDITRWSFNVGSEVFVLGYPRGITSLNNSYPIAKSGTIASVPGQKFAIEIIDTNRSGHLTTKRLEGKLLLIDGLIVPGNSGGPVIIPSMVKTRVDSAGQRQWWNRASENMIIGILSGNFGDSGLSLVYSSNYISQVVDAFLKQRKWIPIQE